MRFIHTADWHLGRSFFNISLIEDQAHVLNQLIEIVQDSKPDALIVAGDVYDRAVPPTDAVRLLDDVLCRLILDIKVPVIMIAGNHDNPLRLEFAARLMESQRLFVFGSLSGRLQAIDMFDAWGRVGVYPMPYAEPSQVGAYLQDEGVANNEDALRHWIAIVNKNRIEGCRTILVNHAFVVGGEESESERPMDIGGTGMVPVECFDGFHYVALGHLHRPQCLGDSQNVHYSGSLLKYSFSEATHTKCVKLVEMDSVGVCTTESIPLIPKHDVRRVEGTADDLLHGRVEVGNSADYIQVALLDEGAVFDAMGRLRDVFPNLVSIDRQGLINNIGKVERVDHRQREMLGLFRDFYKFVTDEPITEEQMSVLVRVANRVRESEREA